VENAAIATRGSACCLQSLLAIPAAYYKGERLAGATGGVPSLRPYAAGHAAAFCLQAKRRGTEGRKRRRERGRLKGVGSGEKRAEEEKHSGGEEEERREEGRGREGRQRRRYGLDVPWICLTDPAYFVSHLLLRTLHMYQVALTMYLICACLL